MMFVSSIDSCMRWLVLCALVVFRAIVFVLLSGGRALLLLAVAVFVDFRVEGWGVSHFFCVLDYPHLIGVVVVMAGCLPRAIG